MKTALDSGAIVVVEIFYHYVAVAERNGEIIRVISRDRREAVRELRKRIK